jgi:hypothetical protein
MVCGFAALFAEKLCFSDIVAEEVRGYAAAAERSK